MVLYKVHIRIWQNCTKTQPHSLLFLLYCLSTFLGNLYAQLSKSLCTCKVKSIYCHQWYHRISKICMCLTLTYLLERLPRTISKIFIYLCLFVLFLRFQRHWTKLFPVLLYYLFLYKCKSTHWKSYYFAMGFMIFHYDIWVCVNGSWLFTILFLLDLLRWFLWSS